MLTDNLTNIFSEIENNHGNDCLIRVKKMLLPVAYSDRHPLQKEAKYILPGLSTTPWKKLEDFPTIQSIANKLEEFLPDIKQQINNIENNQNVISYNHYKFSLKDWKALYFYRDGDCVEENLTLIPAIRPILKRMLAEDLLCPLGEMHLSILKPGVKIIPHSDLWNFTLNLHYAILIPENCGIRVGNETKGWEEGKSLLFDYSYEHEAWNNSDKIRVCMLMDLWHPDVTIPERKALVALMTEIQQLMIG